MSLRRALGAFSLCVVTGCASSPKPATTAEVAQSTAATAPPSSSSSSSSSGGKEAVPSAPTKQARRSTGDITRAELNAVLDAAPGRFLQHVETTPRFVGGRFRGWRLASFFPGDPRFASVDLQAGDVVLSVNGQSIEQPEQLMHVWESLRFERKLVISIERDGQPRELRFDIRD